MNEEELNALRAQVESGESAQPDAEEAEDKETPTEDSQTEQEVETEESSQEESVKEEARVPYSRFETVNERAIRAEEEAKYLREQLEATQQSNPVQQGDLPDYWVELYGDSDLSRKAWSAEQRRMEALQETATTRAIESIKNAQQEEVKALEERTNEIENSFTSYSKETKRSFSDDEQSKMLDIMDEFTPKDAEGNYVAPLLSVEKAVEIFDLRKNNSSKGTKEARRKVVSMTSASSEGEPSGEKASGFRPGQWDSWRDNPMLPR